MEAAISNRALDLVARGNDLNLELILGIQKMQSQDDNVSALLGDAPPQESLCHPNSIKKILERKTRLKQWPIEKKLEKLSFYSRCTYNTECGCSGKLDNSQILYNV